MAKPLIKLPSVEFREMQKAMNQLPAEIATSKAELADKNTEIADKDAEIARLKTPF